MKNNDNSYINYWTITGYIFLDITEDILGFNHQKQVSPPISNYEIKKIIRIVITNSNESPYYLGKITDIFNYFSDNEMKKYFDVNEKRIKKLMEKIHNSSIKKLKESKNLLEYLNYNLIGDEFQEVVKMDLSKTCSGRFELFFSTKEERDDVLFILQKEIKKLELENNTQG